MLRTVPLIRSLRHHYQKAQISIVVAIGQDEVFCNCPYIDTIIPDITQDQSIDPVVPRVRKVLRLVRLAAKLRGRFDLVIGPSFEGATANLLAFLVGAQYRIGFDAGLGFLLSTNLGPIDHELTIDERNDKLLEAAGIEKAEPRLEMHTAAEDSDYTEALLRRHRVTDGELLVGLHAGSDWSCQQWPIDRWARLGDELTDRYRAKLVLTGSYDEIELAEQISSLMANKPVSAVGDTTLGQLAALISRFALVIAVDSIVPSIALAKGVPVVLLCRSGHTQWRRAPWKGLKVLYNDSLGWPTWSAECRVDKQRTTTRCIVPEDIGIDGMGLITVQEVLEAADEQIGSQRGIRDDNGE